MIHIFFNKAEQLNTKSTLSIIYALYYTNYKINNTEFELFPNNRVMTNSLLIKFKGQNIDPDITILPIPSSISYSTSPGRPATNICNHLDDKPLASAVYVIFMVYTSGEYKEVERGILDAMSVAVKEINANDMLLEKEIVPIYIDANNNVIEIITQINQIEKVLTVVGLFTTLALDDFNVLIDSIYYSFIYFIAKKFTYPVYSLLNTAGEKCVNSYLSISFYYLLYYYVYFFYFM